MRFTCILCSFLVVVLLTNVGAPQPAEARNRKLIGLGIGLAIGAAILSEEQRRSRRGYSYRSKERPRRRYRSEDRRSRRQPQSTQRADEVRLSRENVSKMQDALKRLGFYRGEVDGRSGPQTRQAVSGFQRSISVAATGYLTEEQMQRLVTAGDAISPPDARPQTAALGATQPPSSSSERPSVPPVASAPAPASPNASSPLLPRQQPAAAPQFVTSADGAYRVYKNVKISGRILLESRPSSAVSRDACSQKCIEMASCKAYQLKSGQCRLIASPVEVEPANDNGTITGVKQTSDRTAAAR